MNLTWTLVGAVFILSLNLYADDKPLAGGPPQNPPPSSLSTTGSGGAGPAKRTRELNFDDSLLEGLNARSLDSIENIGVNDKRKKTHLYWKRQAFKRELTTGAKEMEFQP